MAVEYKASVVGREVRCPVCSCERYHTKNFLVAGKWLQALDLEGFGREGIMLICCTCSNIQHFADKDAVAIEPVKD